jgi:uncharacterized protein (TIGR02001 family)
LDIVELLESLMIFPRLSQIAAVSLITFAAGTAASQAADLTATPPAPVAPVVAPTPAFDFAFGGKLMSDYISRGITQSNHQPSATAYGELRYNFDSNWQAYAGTQFWSVKLPTDPAAEVDLYGGIRPTFGNFSGDLGAIYYWYPNNSDQFFTDGTTTFLNPSSAALPSALRCPTGPFCATTAKDPSYVEVYFKPSYAVTDSLTLGGNFYYSPNWDNYGVDEGYVSGTAKYAFGSSGFSVSGEVGHEFIGDIKAGTVFSGSAPFDFVGYTTWNAGVSYNWKVLTLDLRYYGTSLSKSECYIDSSDPAGNPGSSHPGSSNWCGNTVMASLSFDLTADNLK